MTTDALTTVPMATLRPPARHVASDHARPTGYRGKRRHPDTDAETDRLTATGVLVLLAAAAAGYGWLMHLIGVW